MNSRLTRLPTRLRLLAASLVAATASLGAGLAHATVFQNPFEAPNPGLSDNALDNLQSTAVVSFTANATGTLNGFFVGGFAPGTVGYADSVGVVLGALPSNRSALQSTPTSGGTSNPGSGYGADNYTLNFGDKVFNSLAVTAGQSITFVLREYRSTSGGASKPNSNVDYIWSDERSDASTSYGSNGNAMAITTGYQSTSTIVANTGCSTNGSGYTRDCVAATRAGSTGIAAGSYTYIGFNDWQGGPSNSYYDFSFLFNITCASGLSVAGNGTGSPDACRSTTANSAAPEPGTLALAAGALWGALAVRRRRLNAERAAASMP
jgi:hypothetical protein